MNFHHGFENEPPKEQEKGDEEYKNKGSNHFLLKDTMTAHRLKSTISFTNSPNFSHY